MRAIYLAIAVVSLSACGDAPPANTPPQEGATPPAATDAPAAATPPPAASEAKVAATPPPSATAAAAGGKKNDPNEAPLLGKLTEADVQRTLVQNFGNFDPCYPESIKKKKGDIKVQLKPTIGPSGKVNEALVLKSSGDKKFDACAVDAFKKIQFPASKEGSAYVTPTWIELGGEMIMQK